MRILVDAMGGDNAPDQIALGAIQAAKDFGCETVLVGRGEAILQALKDQGIETLPKGVEIANADDVVDMHDDPATVVKKKKDSSMVVGLTMLNEPPGQGRNWQIYRGTYGVCRSETGSVHQWSRR